MSDDQNSKDKLSLKLEEDAKQDEKAVNVQYSTPSITEPVIGAPEENIAEGYDDDSFDLDDEDYDLTDDELDIDLQMDLDELSDIESDVLDEEFSPDTDIKTRGQNSKPGLRGPKIGASKKLILASLLFFVAVGSGLFFWASSQTPSYTPVAKTARVADRSPYVASADINEQSQPNTPLVEEKERSQQSDSNDLTLNQTDNDNDTAFLSPETNSPRLEDVSNVDFSDFGLPQARVSKNEIPAESSGNISAIPKIFDVINAPDRINGRDSQNNTDLVSSEPAPEQNANFTNVAGGLDTMVQAGIKKASPRQSEIDFFDSNINRFTSNKMNKTADKVSTAKFIVVSNVVRTDNLEAQVQAANRALDMGYNDAAVEMFAKLYDQNPRDMRILMGYAVALQNTGQIGKAVDKYDEVLRIDENNTEAILNMLGLVKDQYPAVAARRLDSLLKKNPNNPQIAAQLGITHAQLGDLDKALTYLGMASSLEPRNAQHMFNIAVIADKKGMKVEAVKYYEKALQIDSVNQQKNVKIPRDLIYDRLSKLR